MSIDRLKELIPDYARDIRLNLSVLTEEVLTPQRLWGTALVAALASRQADVIAALAPEADARLTSEARRARPPP